MCGCSARCESMAGAKQRGGCGLPRQHCCVRHVLKRACMPSQVHPAQHRAAQRNTRTRHPALPPTLCRAVASPQLKRHRQLRQALKSRGKELQGVVEESRRDQQALEALTRQLGQALAARQEQQVQDTMQQLFQLHMRRQGLKV